MTQQHRIACVRSDESLEPAFKKLLRYHWMEEARHARLDELLVARLAAGVAPAARDAALDDYLAIVATRKAREELTRREGASGDAAWALQHVCMAEAARRNS